MQTDPKPQFRAPLCSPAARGSAFVLGASMLALIGSTETLGVIRYLALAAALVLAIVGIRRDWHVAKRETELLR